MCAKLRDQPMHLRTEVPFREIQTVWREVSFCKAVPCEHFSWETDYVKSPLHIVGGCEYDSTALCMEWWLFSYLQLQFCVLRVSYDVRDVL